MGTEIAGGGGGGTILHATLSPPQWFCVTVGSDESHVKFYSLWRGKVTKIVSTNHNFWRERTPEVELNWGPSAYQYQPTSLPLGQTDSLDIDFIRGCTVFTYQHRVQEVPAVCRGVRPLRLTVFHRPGFASNNFCRISTCPSLKQFELFSATVLVIRS